MASYAKKEKDKKEEKESRFCKRDVKEKRDDGNHRELKAQSFHPSTLELWWEKDLPPIDTTRTWDLRFPDISFKVESYFQRINPSFLYVEVSLSLLLDLNHFGSF